MKSQSQFQTPLASAAFFSREEMKTTSRSLRCFALCCAAFALASTFGCSSAAPKKYVFFGEPQPQEVEIFEDFWADDPSVFKPDDPTLPLRRGKGGVIRFFKKNSYAKSILVDGTLTVNVYDGVDEGITMTQPDAQLVVSSKDLNEKYRSYDKKVGYTYHIWLDLGEYDQPEKEMTILSVFKDEKSGQATLSKPIRTVAPGTTPLPPKDDNKRKLSAAERWALDKLGSEASSDPIGDLQRRYSARVAEKIKADEENAKTRVRESIDVSETRLRAIDDDSTDARGVRGASFLRQAQDERDARLAQYLEERREQRENYRAKRDEYLAETPSRFDRTNPLDDKSGGAMSALNFRDVRPDYRTEVGDFAAKMSARADEMSQRADEEYRKGPDESGPNGSEPLTVGYDADALADADADAASRPRRAAAARTSVYAAPSVAFADESTELRPASTNSRAALLPSDGFDDFQPSGNAPPTEVYVGKSRPY